MMKKLCSVFLSFTLIFLIIGNVSAMQSQSNKKNATAIDSFGSAVEILEPYVIRQTDSTFALNAPKKIISMIPADMFQEIMQGMQITNQMVREQNLVTTNDLRVYGSTLSVSNSTASLLSGGVNKLVLRWYGWDLYLNHQTCHALSTIGSGSIGFVAAILIAAIPAVAPVAGIVAAAVLLTIGIISYVNQGNGVILRITHTGSVFWVSSQ